MSFKGKVSTIINQDYFFSVISKVIGVFLAIVYSAFYNRYLGTVLKGDAAIISNYISLISSFTALGMYQAYPYYRKKGEDIFYPFINNMTSLYLLMTGVCVVLALTLPVNTNLKFAICLVPIQSFIRHINYVVMIEVPRRQNISSIILHIEELIVVLGFFFFSKATYFYLILILLIQNVANLALSWVNLRVSCRNLHFDLSQVPKYAKYGFIPMVTLLLMTLNYRVDILMLEDVFDIPKAMIGIYSVGISLGEKIWLIPDALKDILMSHLANGSNKDETAKVTRLSLAVILAMLVAMILLGKPFILFLYGNEYEDAYSIFLIMLAGVVGMVFYKMIYAHNVVHGKRIVNLIFLGIAAIANIVWNYLLIPYGGIFAAAWASVISYLVCGFAFLIYFCITEKVNIKDVLFVKKSDIALFKKMFK